MDPTDSRAPEKPRVLASFWPSPVYRSNMLGAKPGKPIELRQIDPPWRERLGSKLKARP